MWDIVLTDMPGFVSGMGANRLNFQRVYISGNRATYSMPIRRYNNRGHSGAAVYSEVSLSFTQYIMITLTILAFLYLQVDTNIFQDARWYSLFGR